MISFFARPAWVGNYYPRHVKESQVHRLSSRIRGEEIATYLGARLNPRSGYEHDVCIHVKPLRINKIPDGAWIDVLDDGRLIDALKKRQGLKVIAGSKYSYEYIKTRLPNEIAYIPSHHINWDRERRTRSDVKTVGYIGSVSPEAVRIYADIGKQIADIGLQFITCFTFKTRMDALDLYRQIDILIIAAWEFGDPNPHKIPTKIINAASFGIPTVAFPLASYEEFKGHYLPVVNIQQLLDSIQSLRQPEFYARAAEDALAASEPYHISRVAELYKELT